MWAVFKKEWLGNFRNLSGWIFLSVTLFFMGWYFRYYGLTNGMPYISYVLDAVLFIFLFTMPLITMRSFAEEKRHRTDQLLFTSPVKLWQIVLGKYLAAVSVFLPVFPVMIIYPLIMRIYGDVPFNENVLAVVGFFFFGLAALGIGVFISSLTENQMIAAVLSFFVLLLSAMIKAISSMISVKGNALTTMLSIFDLTGPFDNSLYGVLYWPDYVYYLSVAFLTLFYTEQMLTARRFSVRAQGVPWALVNTLKIVLVTGVIVALNIGVRALPYEKKSMDLTYNGIRSITDESRATLAALDRPVQIFILSSEDDKDETLEATLQRMEEASGYVKVDHIDPKEQPYFYLDYTDIEPLTNSMIVTSGTKSRVVNYYDCYQVSYDYAYDVSSGGYVTTDYHVSGYDGEGRIMSAIRYVINDHVPKIYCINGHDEFEPDEELVNRISNAGFDMESVNLLLHEDIPDDGDIIFILAPVKDMNNDDIAKIRRFMEKGKNAVLITGYTEGAELDNFYSLLSDFGMEVLPGVVSETDPAYYNGTAEFLLPEIVECDLTRAVYTTGRTRFIYMPFSRGIRLKETADVSGMTFLRTTEGAYVKVGRDIEKGPFSLGVYTERYGEAGVSRVITFTTDYFLYKDINMAVNGSNYELFMRSLLKISETEEEADVPVKPYSYDPILVGPTSRGVLSFILTGVLPGAVLLVGIGIWYYRRRN
ncbi:MAG: Gldg family protein [Lachnospiraceae bacterium]|nr:Gldg family protein [Lachnospiraceae bacterium]